MSKLNARVTISKKEKVELEGRKFHIISIEDIKVFIKIRSQLWLVLDDILLSSKIIKLINRPIITKVYSE